jgi:hypothetical protein
MIDVLERTRLFRVVRRASASPRLVLEGGLFVSDARPRAAQLRSPSGSWLTSQWWAGLSEKGEIGRYAPSTIRLKMRTGLPWDRVTLFQTGRLYAETSFTLKREGLIVKANTPYARYLVARYGPRILWLGGAYLRAWQEQLVVSIIKSLKKSWLSDE